MQYHVKAFIKKIFKTPRRVLGRILILSLSPLCAAASNATIAAPTETFTPRENAWSIGTSLRQLNISSSQDYKLNTIAPYLDIGRGWVHANWWSSIELNLILGPNGKRLPESPPLDFTGNGLRMRIGHSLPGRPLRQAEGDWGAEIGLEYNEWIARSYRDETLADGQISKNWVVRSRWIFIQPALFYSLWRPARPQGHKPEWLTTRVEGMVISLGMSVPIQSQFQASYSKNNEKQSLNDHWRGTLAFLSITSWLGI